MEFYNVLFSPTKWFLTVVAAIFKNKGSPRYAKYYRPVSLVQLLYKWFDFIVLTRFKVWFTPADEQTAYQTGKSCADHIFLLRCLISYSKYRKVKFFICTIDFDGAFDWISRNILLKKLAMFGAGSVFLFCIATMYRKTESVIFQKDEYSVFEMLSGIKQGLPMSPYLFLFYIHDIFYFFHALYDGSSNILDEIHLLFHADDANILAASRDHHLSKIRSMFFYCNLNVIKVQLSKCMFMVINRSGDDKDDIELNGYGILPITNEIMILGTPISESGNLREDLNTHLNIRYKNCIKFFNFIRENRSAPTSIKLKVLTSCVTSTSCVTT